VLEGFADALRALLPGDQRFFWQYGYLCGIAGAKPALRAFLASRVVQPA
jgi:hypothetical protein